jgi:transglutaminase-like putative cysteine protease
MLSVTHVSEYRYASPVTLHDHRLMVRPRDSHDLRLISAELVTSPAPRQVRWYHDVFGNSVAVVEFDVEADRLEITSNLLLETFAPFVEAPQITDQARAYPFSYTPDDQRDLGGLRDRQYQDPDARMADWVRDGYSSFTSGGNGTIDTLELLSGLNELVGRSFSYERRDAEGTQTPTETIERGCGSCRDFALLYMEAARQLGFAARFVSGYLVDQAVLANGTAAVGGGATHAWAQVYVPGLGWVEFDPTNQIVGSNQLIRVAVTRDPSQAVPISGTFTGPAGAMLGLNVNVTVGNAP